MHRDYQEGRASGPLFRRRYYLRGYIDGAMDVIGIKPDQVSCASGCTGTVKRLDELKAEQLRAVLHELLVPWWKRNTSTKRTLKTFLTSVWQLHRSSEILCNAAITPYSPCTTWAVAEFASHRTQAIAI